MKNWIVPEFQRSLTKQPSEEVKIDCDFTDEIPAYFGQITSATFSAQKWPISDPDTKSDGVDIFDDGTEGLIEAPYLMHARIMISQGDVDFDYLIKCIATMDDDQQLEKDFFIRVRE